MTGQRIELAEYIRHLRRQVTKASKQGAGKSVRFEIDALELELQTVAERTKDGEGGLKLWIASLGGKASAKDQVTQKIKLTLRPKSADGTTTKLGRGTDGG